MKSSQPVHAYRNYRELLCDRYESAKSGSSGYTYAKFAKKAGLGSPNYLKMVIDGKRNLTPANIQAFAKGLGLIGGEVEAFEALVLENQAETSAERNYYRRRLAQIRNSASHSLERRAPGSSVESSLRLAILLCAQGRTREDGVKIAVNELGTSEALVSRELDSLLQDAELTLDSKSGILETSSRHSMMSDPKALSQRQQRFLAFGLKEAQEVFNARYAEGGAAKFLSLVLTAPEGSLPALFGEMRDAAEKAAVRFDPAQGESAGVYRLQVQVYRMKKNSE